MKRVLVIDDEPAVREVVQGCLEDLAGWQVLTAASGLEGLEKAAVEQPDAIVLDMMMPGMDGLAFLQQFGAAEKTPVVLLTAKLEFLDPQQVVRLGITGAIAKPFDPFRLCTEIADLLNWEVPCLK